MGKLIIMNINIAHLIIAGLSFFGAVAGVYAMLVTRITKVETDIRHLDSEQKRIGNNMDVKLDKLFSEISDLKVLIARGAKHKKEEE